MGGLTSFLPGLFMIAVLVLVHEFGHFAAAKIFGIGAPVFSLGFGPRVVGVVWRGTDFRISAIPFGGYVQLAGADAFGEENAEDEVAREASFTHRPVWQRLIVMAAGPGVNLALPFVLFTGLLMAGRPDWGTHIGQVLPGTVAEQLGMASGDSIVAIDGDDAVVWTDVEQGMARRVGTSGDVRVTLDRDGTPIDVVLPASALQQDHDGRPNLLGLGLQPYALSTRVGLASPTAPAALAGLTLGDRILTVDGKEVPDWPALLTALSGSRHAITWERQSPEGATSPGAGELVRTDWAPLDADRYGNVWGLVPVTLFAQRVEEGAPAQEAGLLADDRFLAIDGQPVLSFYGFIDQVAATLPAGSSVPRPIQLDVVRAGEVVSLTMTPRVKVVSGEAYPRPIIGVGSYGGVGTAPARARKYYGPVEAVVQAASETGDLIARTTAVLGNLFTGRSDPRENLGGPVAIFVTAGEVAELGFFSYATVVGMISVSLGLINLLPVPVLDGGQILFYLVEAVRGRPLSLQLRERVQMIGVVALVVLFVLVTINDVHRWWTLS